MIGSKDFSQHSVATRG